MKCYRDLFKKKKKIKTMNNKMAINTCLSTIESKQTNSANKNRDRIMVTESVFMVARWERYMGERVKR